MELIYRDRVIQSKQESFLINAYQDFEELNQEQQFYIEEAQKCVAICSEANNECYCEDDGNGDNKIKYPVIIDHRSKKVNDNLT